jgi:5-(carboxyamino)imidazole ribonucleotide synthase
MFNLIGKHPDSARVLAIPEAHLHLYGKTERAGRKLGHVTIRSRNRDDLLRHADALRAIPLATSEAED